MNYEGLNVFKESHKFVLEIYDITKSFPKDEKFRLIDQLIRASYSIPSNIAEGNNRNTTKDYINFLLWQEVARVKLNTSCYYQMIWVILAVISTKP